MERCWLNFYWPARPCNKAACDAPSQLSLHYSGAAVGPVSPYGIEMRQFAAESSLFLLPDPALAIVRTQASDDIITE